MLSESKVSVLSFFALIFIMKLKGMRSCWSRNTVFFFMRECASVRFTLMSRPSTVVSRIHVRSLIPPFSSRETML